MMYTCSQCGRIMDYPEALSFCPFCAAAYDRAELESPAPSAQPLRIVIDSDSTRDVQKKYWQMARISCNKALHLLMNQVLEQEETPTVQLNFAAWLDEQRTITSGAQFRRGCDRLIDKIHKALTDQKAMEQTAPIDLDAKADEINKVCLRLAEALGYDNPKALCPALKYQENGEVYSVKEPDDRKAGEDVHDLLEAVLRARPVFYQALDEGGIYIAFSSGSSAAQEDANDASPAKLAQTLDALTVKDYDPLFGEQYDDFLSAFWLSLKTLAKAVNKFHHLPKVDKKEADKRLALETLSNDWAEALGLALDQTYQKGQLNMMYVYSDVSSICKEMEELSKYEPKDGEDDDDD